MPLTAHREERWPPPTRWERFKNSVVYHFDLFCWHFRVAPLRCRRGKKELFWRTLYGNLQPCRAWECIFYTEDGCKNPVYYDVWKKKEIVLEPIVSCSESIYKEGEDDDPFSYRNSSS